MRKTKIIATLGPVTGTVEVIKELINGGLDGARINFSHGTHESHTEIINRLKQAREELNKNVALILDTKGPEIRTKSLKDKTVNLEKGKTFIITGEDIVGDNTRVSVTYPELIDDMAVNGCILVDDGLIELKVIEKRTKELVCEVINSGTLGENKGINVPNVKIKLPALTEKDKNDIIFGIKMEFDYIAASFIRSAQDVLSIKKLLKENNAEHIKIICKIENREGVDNIDEILDVTDGIMVARGDLGVEVPLEEVPIMQKLLIKKSREKGKLVVTATHLLESMIINPRPTRAEASDVANAIFDGTDAIMLSGETAKGSYPIHAIKMMSKIATKTEYNINYNKIVLSNDNKFTKSITNAISTAACISSAELEIPYIICVTKSGYTAQNVAKMRPGAPIIAITYDPVVYRQLQLNWATTPLLLEESLFKDYRSISFALDLAVKEIKLKEDEKVVIVAGMPVGKVANTNTLRIHRIGQPLFSDQK